MGDTAMARGVCALWVLVFKRNCSTRPYRKWAGLATQSECNRIMKEHSCQVWSSYNSSKKRWRFHSVPPLSDAVAPFMPAVLFPFRMHACIISNWAWSFDVQEGQLVDSPTRIDSFILLWSSKLFWGTSLLLLFNLERVLRSRLDWVRSLLLTINQSRVANWLWSPPNAIAWIERCFFWLS